MFDIILYYIILYYIILYYIILYYIILYYIILYYIILLVCFLTVFAPNSPFPHGRQMPRPSHSSFSFITRIKFGGMYKSRRSLLCKFLQSPAAPSLSAAPQGPQTALYSKWPPCPFRYFIRTLLISSVNINSIKTYSYLMKIVYRKRVEWREKQRLEEQM